VPCSDPVECFSMIIWDLYEHSSVCEATVPYSFGLTVVRFCVVFKYTYVAAIGAGFAFSASVFWDR
jgi:hypothetical protein